MKKDAVIQLKPHDETMLENIFKVQLFLYIKKVNMERS